MPICSQLCRLGVRVDIIEMAHLSSVTTEPGLEGLKPAGGCRDSAGSLVQVLNCLFQLGLFILFCIVSGRFGLSYFVTKLGP